MRSRIYSLRYPGLLVAMVAAVFAIFPALSFGASTAFAVTTSASPAQVVPGNSVVITLKTTYTSSSATRADVILTVVDPNGAQVYRQVWAKQRLRPGDTTTYAANFVTASTAVAGSYTSAVKIQASAGSATLYDNANTGTFSVLAPAATPVPTVTSTPPPAASSTPLPTAQPTASNTPAPTPTDGVAPDGTTAALPLYWGASMDGVPWDLSKLDAWESKVGKKVSIIHFWQFWDDNGVLQPFHANVLDLARSHGAIPMVSWPSERMGGGSTQPDYALSQIINGRYDSYIRSWATAAKSWGHPFFLRFDHEMNGNWMVWSETANGNKPGQFAAAWRHVHDIFTAAGANNATWVWCPNVEFSGSTAPTYASLYPGDAYVDWTCLDGYNWGPSYPANGGWISFSNLYSRSYNNLLQLAPGKPIMIGELASTESGGSKAAWITDALKTQIPVNFPRIKAAVWYNWQMDGMDWRVESSQASLDAFKAAIGGTHFTSNQFATLEVSPVPSPH